MKRRLNKGLGWLLALWWLCAVSTLAAAQGEVDVQEIVFSHIQDAYSWHITEWQGHEISIPLPVIVRNEAGEWSVFSSERLAHGATYQGYHIAQTGEYAGKVVSQDTSGAEIRPLDLSITKNVCALFISCGLLIGIVLSVARWYRRHPMEAPKGFVGVMEVIVCYIQDEVIKPSVGKHYHSFSAYLLTVFFFILLNNLLGIIPIFPGGANLTGNIAVTAILALCTFIATNAFATKHYWKEVFWPDTPIYLKVPLPIMPFVEFFGLFTKPIALTIRLFANIMAGHTIILALTCLIFITAAQGVLIHTGMTAVSVLFCVFMNCLEILVACLQAYIFTILSANFIGMAKEG
ncbi:MAG: F0F1 ATP synthase subunit A [Parabacteroides sp.]